MGVMLSTLSGKKELRVMMVGLDGAGKTTILRKLQGEVLVGATPTIGFNVETIQIKERVFLKLSDVGGIKKIRPLWRTHCQKTQGIIFVVDSNDQQRMGEAREELHKLLGETGGVPVLVLANKQDRPDAIPEADVADWLGLPGMTDLKWAIESTSAPTGGGLYEGLDWLSQSILATL